MKESNRDMTMNKMIRPYTQRTIGVLGGCSNVATGEYYKLLNASVNGRLGGWDIAETLIVGMNFGNIEALVRAEDWAGLSAYMDDNVRKLADILLCVSNTLHRYLEPISQKYGMAFIHIADPTGAAIRNRGLKRIALFGTKPVMEMDYLKNRLRDSFGLDIVVPNSIERTEIDRIIFDELVKSDVQQNSRDYYVKVANRLVTEHAVEGLILGCTEIFLLLRPEDLPELPMFNTTQLHCEAAVDFALAG
jgi:aspartate racemase